MRETKAEGRRWLEQSENDLEFARYALAGGYHHQACFVSQQSAEKALKALVYADGARSVIGHSVVGLLARLEDRHAQLASLNDFAADLDLFYVPTRYPNGFGDGVPHRAFTRTQAARAIQSAEAIVEAARAALGP